MISIPFDKANISLICEVDEQWPFVGKEKNRRWLWYAWESRYKRIIAHAFGGCNTDALRSLLKPFDISFFLPMTSALTQKNYQGKGMLWAKGSLNELSEPI